MTYKLISFLRIKKIYRTLNIYLRMHAVFIKIYLKIRNNKRKLKKETNVNFIKSSKVSVNLTVEEGRLRFEIKGAG